MSVDIERYRANLRDELNGAALYTALAAAEGDPLRKDLFLQLAQAESNHAQLWRDKLAAAGIRDERFVPAFRTRLLAKLAQRFGPRFVLPTIAAAEFADRNKYAEQSDAQAISAEERGHAAVIQAVAASGARGAVTTGADIARAEPWHRGAASGNNLRAAGARRQRWTGVEFLPHHGRCRRRSRQPHGASDGSRRTGRGGLLHGAW